MELTQKTNRRNFLSALGILGFAGALPIPTLADPKEPKQDIGAILKAGPYLQAAYHDKITIRWITHVPCYSWVEYGEVPDKLDCKTHTLKDGLVTAYNTNNAVKVENLLPGKNYHYRVCSREILDFIPNKIVYGATFASPVSAFKTSVSNADKVEFVVLNDIHDRPESFEVLMKYQGDTRKDFVFLNGDMFNFQTDEDQLVNHLINPLGNIFAANTPFILSRGNHEARGKFARHLCDYFDGGKERYYYSFKHGPVYAIVLDSGEDKGDEVAVYGGIVDFDAYRLAQLEWLKEEVQRKEFRKAKFKIVFSHIPTYYSGSGHGTLHCREHWGPVLNKAKIDLMISGHTHKYGIHPAVKGQHDYPIVIGGGPANGKRTIMNVKVNHKVLNLRMFDDSGKLVGSLDA